ncbi:MAG: DivIVA domain-containing protein [Acidimicrobiales bacterium]|jgi:DivIVA domain-containing protein
MAQEPQVVSISSTAPVSPDEIARKTFPAVRRGLDGEAVRAFLAKVGDELHNALEREAALRTQLAEAERRLKDPDLDEATLTRAIGVETAKILSTAHEAARNVVATAEERAAELIGQSEGVLSQQVAIAEAEALAIRSAAEREADEYAARAQAETDLLTDEAHADAVELLDETKEECRRMVAEARDLRNRTLADLMAKRRALRVQLEELRSGKDSLLRVVDAVAVAVEALRERLVAAEDEARLAADQAGERFERQVGHDELSELEEELAAAGGALGEVDVAGLTQVTSGTLAVTSGEAPAGEGGAPSAEAAPSEDDKGRSGSGASRRSVDELFARIRASRAAEEAALAPGTGEDAPAGSNCEVEILEEVAEGPEPAAVELAAFGKAEEGDGTEGRQGEPEHKAETVTAVADMETVEADKAASVPGASDEAGAPHGPKAASAFDAEAVVEERAAEPGEVLGSEAQEAVALPGADAPGAAGVLDTGTVALAKPLDSDAMTEPDVESLARRDHLLGAVTAKLGRALKRALQDDQNELLNALRQTSRKPVLDELVPPEAQRDRFISAASDQLARAYEAGAAFLVTGDAVEGPSVSAPPPSPAVALEAGTALAAVLADDLSTMLRQRIEEALSELDGTMEGSADAAGVAYREWKGSRVEGLAGDFTTRAFAVGELTVLEYVTNGAAPLVRWAVEDDDGGGSCPDCDDNSLAGPQSPGAPFPTGHSHPPVHPGCRCLLVPVRS